MSTRTKSADLLMSDPERHDSTRTINLSPPHHQKQNKTLQKAGVDPGFHENEKKKKTGPRVCGVGVGVLGGISPHSLNPPV